MSLPLVALGELFDIGSSKRVFKSQWQSEGIPFLRARELVRLAKDGRVECELFISPTMYREYASQYGVPKPGDMLVTGVGTLGVCHVVEDSKPFYFKDGNIIWLRNRGKVDARYVRHAFNTHHVKQQINRAVGTTVGTFTIERANETTVPLPPLPEQKRIAAILDAADALRAKRRESIEQLDSLVQATFLEMFGDPVANPKGWEVHPLGSMCDVRDGTHDSPKYVDAGYPLLTSKNFADGHVDYSGAKLISEEDYRQINKRSGVDVGDLVMPMIGTIGNPVLITQQPDFAIKNVALIKFDGRSPNRRYVHSLLGSAYFDHVTSKANRGGTQKFVALKDLRAIPTPTPPLDLQTRFASIVESIDQQKARLKAHLAELDTLFASLQSRAFNGELVA